MPTPRLTLAAHCGGSASCAPGSPDPHVGVGGPDRVFIGRDGEPMRGGAIRQAFNRARRKVGMPGFRFHDLRHTGQTLAASAGATTKDLMRRLGHASPVAANRYLHTVDGRDTQIAEALSELAEHGGAARLPKSITINH
jgi:integrase